MCIHKKDLHLLKAIQCFFNGAGIIREMKDDLVILMVRSLDEITNIIIPHFDKYPLLTQKYADYLLFKQVAAMMGQKEHLTQGVFFLEKIVSIKASVNLGLPDSLKAAFPAAKLARRDINPVPRPEIDGQLLKALNSDWISGFSSAEGCFLISMGQSATHKTGSLVQLVFQITQHSRDRVLMKSIVDYLGCGRIRERGDYVDVIFSKFSDNLNIIIPMFREHPILGTKALDFEDWQKVSNLMHNKVHLTSEGLEQIRLIKSGMNSGRLK